MLTKYFGAQKYFAVFSEIYFIDMFQEDLENADLITVGVEDVKSVKRVRKLQVRKQAGKNVGFPNLCSHFYATLVTFSLGNESCETQVIHADVNQLLSTIC